MSITTQNLASHAHSLVFCSQACLVSRQDEIVSMARNEIVSKSAYTLEGQIRKQDPSTYIALSEIK